MIEASSCRVELAEKVLESSPFLLTTVPFCQLFGPKILVSSFTPLFLSYLTSAQSVKATYPSLVELLLSKLRNQKDTDNYFEKSFSIWALTTTTSLPPRPCVLRDPAYHKHTSNKEHTRASDSQDPKPSTGTAQLVIINIRSRTSTIQALGNASKISCPMSSKQKLTVSIAVKVSRLRCCQHQGQTRLQCLGKIERWKSLGKRNNKLVDLPNPSSPIAWM